MHRAAQAREFHHRETGARRVQSGVANSAISVSPCLRGEKISARLGCAGMSAPLSGIRVVELASFVAAPAAGALLADLGAEVIKVEVPWGEVYRHSLPRLAGYKSDFGLAPHFHMDNRGKRSVAL